MSNFHVNQIVKGRRCGTFVILGFRTLPGEPDVQYAQVKEVHPSLRNAARGEICMALEDLVAVEA